MAADDNACRAHGFRAMNVGIKRVVEVLDHAPRELTPAECLVLVTIAENVNDKDPQRKTWPAFSQELLAERSRLTGKGSLKDALQRLSKRGLEVRVPMGIGKDGRTLYAIPGKQCRYRLPVFQGEGTTSPCVDEGEGTTSPGEGTASPEEVTTSPGEATTSPYSSPSPSSPLSGAAALIRAARVVAESEERELADWIQKTHNPRGIGWWRTTATNGDLPDLADQWRASRPTPPAPAAPPKPACQICDAPFMNPVAGVTVCRACRDEP